MEGWWWWGFTAPTAANFGSQGDAHMWTNAQIKFLYYPLILPHLHMEEGGRGSKYVKSHDLNWGKIHLNKKGDLLI